MCHFHATAKCILSKLSQFLLSPCAGMCMDLTLHKIVHDELPISFAISGGVSSDPPLNLATVVKFDYARKRALCICCVYYCVVFARKRAVSYCVNNAIHKRAMCVECCLCVWASRLN